jgi:sterol desaturase/sphingolipid hydroxylase (fatty acid hydroxylase superfamily)
MSFSLESLLSLALSFILLAALFIPMEKVFPAKTQRIFRPQWWLDLTFFLGQNLVWGTFVLWCTRHFSVQIHGLVPASFRETIDDFPFLLQCLIALLFSDFLIYWGHRLQHRVDFLWRFHKVHHTSEHLDWLAAYREHPLDSVYTIGIVNLPAIIMGFSLESIAAVIAFRGIWAVYIHSNVRFNIGPLKMLIGSPDLHHWHHDLDRRAGNYANISPMMDLLFGTYRCPDYEPEAFGIREDAPKTYLGHMVEPLLHKNWWQKLRAKTGLR